jgi:ankyrin repeat protein
MKTPYRNANIAKAIAKNIQQGMIQSNVVALGNLETEPVLCQAVLRGETDKVKTLLASGADPNVCNKQNRNKDNFLGEPPLVHAVRSGRIAIVEALLQAGANPNYKPVGRSLLTYAIWAKHLEIAVTLLQHGAKVETGRKNVPSALEAAIDRAFPEAFRLLVKQGADINAPDSDGGSLLCRALVAYTKAAKPLPPALRGIAPSRAQDAVAALEIIREILRLGPEVNRSDRYGHTALMASVAIAPIDIIEQIIGLGSDLDAETSAKSLSGAGLRAIHCAVNAKRTEVVELLIRKHANVSKPLPDGRSLTQYAREQSSAEVTSFVERTISAHSRPTGLKG